MLSLFLTYSTQCTAERPRCRRCSRRDQDCHYESQEFNKNRYENLKKSYDDLVSDRESCQELFGLLETAGAEESQHIFRQIREGEAAATVLRHVREAHLLVNFSGGPDEGEVGEGEAEGGEGRIRGEDQRLTADGT